MTQPISPGALTDSPAQIVQALLVQLRIASDPGSAATLPWPVYAPDLPDMPDACLRVTDTLGTEFGKSQPDGELLVHHGFQVLVRSTDHPTGWRQADLVRDALAKRCRLTTVAAPLGTGGAAPRSYLVFNINGIGPVLTLGLDNPTSRRRVFSINAKLVVRQLS
jgi:hypothetical protein